MCCLCEVRIKSVHACPSFPSGGPQGLIQGYLHTISTDQQCITSKIFTYFPGLQHKEDPLHFCWLLKKVTRSGKNCSLEEFLETERFSRKLISQCEWLYGQGFLSTGGLGTFLEMLSLLNLQPGEKVLDVAFYMAKNCITISCKLASPLVQFELCDATMREFPENTFDVVYSKDSILYTMDKFSLFQKFHRWLKPTGRFIISDFCCGEKPWSEEFQKFADQSGYILWTLSAMGKSLQDAGFAEVHVTDANPKNGGKHEQLFEVRH
uniref:phosphoethanolamine N-methyltransferase n=1 Tax=Eptatretus burgeri TaxID=7764 RepID=A0A8C4NKI2_EPTBU